MPFQDWGEERFIQYLAKQFPSTSSIVGIGDDCGSFLENKGWHGSSQQMRWLKGYTF